MIRQGQNIFDLAVQEYGELDFASEIVSLNRVSFDGDLTIDDEIETNAAGKGDEEVKVNYVELNYKPVNG